MGNAYRAIVSAGSAAVGDATAADVLTGKTFSGAVGSGVSGTMPNQGAVSGTATPNQPYTIPAGYHNGNGVVTSSGVDPSTFNAKVTPNEVAYSTPYTFTLESANISVVTVVIGAYFVIYDVNGNTLTARSGAGDPSYLTVSKSGTSLSVTQTLAANAYIFIAYI